jgi:hypothetical protein
VKRVRDLFELAMSLLAIAFVVLVILAAELAPAIALLAFAFWALTRGGAH